jgi:hypothetical protein
MVTVEVGQGDARRWLVLGVTGQQHHTLHSMAAAGARRAAPRRRRLAPAPFAQLLLAAEVPARGPKPMMRAFRRYGCQAGAAAGLRRPAWRTAGRADRPGRCRWWWARAPGGTSYSVPIQTLLFFTALSFLPAVLLLMTGFTRIVIVLSLLRQALGTQAAPPNQVIIGLSLFLTFFVMPPTLDKVYEQAWQPSRPTRSPSTRRWKARRRCASSCSSRRARADVDAVRAWPSCPPP